MESLSEDDQASSEETAMEIGAVGCDTGCDDNEEEEDGDEEEPAEPHVLASASAHWGIKLSLPILQNGRFRNPWNSKHRSRLRCLFKFLFFSLEERRTPRNLELDTTLPVLQPDFTEFDEPPLSGIRYLWIGHSSSLVQFDGVTFLTDPIFSDRCSPVQFMGIRRYRPTPCTVDQLPKVDFVIISHSHYDHLDHGTVVALNQKFGMGLRWYVPTGMARWMASCGCTNVVELMWWQENVFHEDLNITVACTPAKHWSRRTANDENKMLWCSWTVIGPKHNFYFCGDSGYCECFKQIGQRYGPFTLAALPIGAYCPRESLSSMHLDPEGAVDAHEDIQSCSSIGIHWGTFSLTQEPYLEPKELLEAEVQKRGMKPSSFFTVNHGEIILVGNDDFNDID